MLHLDGESMPEEWIPKLCLNTLEAIKDYIRVLRSPHPPSPLQKNKMKIKKNLDRIRKIRKSVRM